jgi:ketosteroid isomerase-like protein
MHLLSGVASGRSEATGRSAYAAHRDPAVRDASVALERDPVSKLARRVLDALGRGDAAAFGELCDPDVEIHTAREVRRGVEEARAWAERTYDHLDKRYEVEEIHLAGERALALARIQYVWRDSGAVGDETPVAIALDFKQGLLRRWRLFDDPSEGLKVFGRSVEQRCD